MISTESSCAGRVQVSGCSKLAGARSTGEHVLLPNDSQCCYPAKSQQHHTHSKNGAAHDSRHNSSIRQWGLVCRFVWFIRAASHRRNPVAAPTTHTRHRPHRQSKAEQASTRATVAAPAMRRAQCRAQAKRAMSNKHSAGEALQTAARDIKGRGAPRGRAVSDRPKVKGREREGGKAGPRRCAAARFLVGDQGRLRGLVPRWGPRPQQRAKPQPHSSLTSGFPL